MNIPVYYTCHHCQGKFPNKDYSHKDSLCQDCADLTKTEMLVDRLIDWVGEEVTAEQIRSVIWGLAQENRHDPVLVQASFKEEQIDLSDPK